MKKQETKTNRSRRPSPNWVIAGGLGVAMALVGLVAPGASSEAQSATLVPVGRLFASNCSQCHGTDGQSGSISQLAGMGAASMFTKMKDQQTHNSIMGAQARGYTDDEIRAIAAYFASVKKK
jgi:cytochrome c553